MTTSSSPAAPDCKCCGASSTFCGQLDFSKNCEEPQGIKLPRSGHMVDYYRCDACGFIFSTFLDAYSTERLMAEVYNDVYTQVDPNWLEERPRAVAALISNNFGAFRDNLRILDYGCGNGRAGELLSAAGFPDVVSFDPMQEAFSEPPTGHFDVILCFEVFEHLPDPRAVCREIVGLTRDQGIVVHTTMLQPPDIDTQMLDWWYIAPRNGHISIFSAKSLAQIWAESGFSLVTFGGDVHIAYRVPPPFAPDLATAGELLSP